VNNVVEIKVESKKQKIPMKKGKLIQPLLLLPLLKLCASFEDAASLSSIVCCTSLLVLFQKLGGVIFIGNVDLHFLVLYRTICRKRGE
jgi:hypothetical protein